MSNYKSVKVYQSETNLKIIHALSIGAQKELWI